MKLRASFLILPLLLIQAQWTPSMAAASKVYSFQAEGWADNWFSLYINGKKVGEDSVPITTVRSFNQTTLKFKASYPFTVGIIAKDYVENSSGLEYIGQSNQQIGDGGFILQIRDLSSGKIISATNSDWKSFVVNKAPINQECEKSSQPLMDCKSSSSATPSGWSSSAYKDTQWKNASEFSESQVGVKDGYLGISWSPNAKLIWSSDLRLDNTILFRHIVKSATSDVITKSAGITSSSLVVTSASIDSSGALDKTSTCDGAGISPSISWSAGPAGTLSFVVIMDTIPGPPRPGEVEAASHTYLALYNIPATTRFIGQGTLNAGTVGLNFKSKVGYEPPCSQGPGVKDYTITVLALSAKLELPQSQATQTAISQSYQGKILSSGKVIGHYERK